MIRVDVSDCDSCGLIAECDGACPLILPVVVDDRDHHRSAYWD
jgi:hypothetical protein